MGQKAKKITDKQYQHARKMAFAKSIDGLPKKVAQWVDDSVLLESRYLFTRRENGVRYGYCTHCHKDVVLELDRTYCEVDVLNINRKHKEIGFCPACKSPVQFRDMGRGRGRWVDEGYVVFADRLRDGGVLVRAGFVRRDYSEEIRDVGTDFFERYRIYYNTDVDVAWNKVYSYYGGYNWGRMTTIPEPSAGQPYYTSEKNYIYTRYYGFTDEIFKKTNLKYAQIETVMSDSRYVEVCSYLDRFVKNPELVEKLVKEGFLVFASHQYCQAQINRRAKTVSAALGLNKKELRELEDKTDAGVKYAQIAKAYGITPAQARKYASYGSTSIENVEKRLPFKKAVKYLDKQEETIYTLCDYWSDCEKLNLDLSREDILLPPDLAQAHQRTIDALAEARRQKELEETRRTQEEFGKRLKKLERDFAFESGNLLIRPARGHAELINEGSALHHCVATYAQRHLSGQTVIFFIRKKSEPDKPFYTLEYNPKTKNIVQCRGLYNCGKTPEVEAFVNAWSGYIRNKKKKSHAVA
nr:MAG TPA: PcfJ like protein [Caudoviricetes sp.]